MTYFSIFNSNINVQASFLLDRPRRDGKTGKGKKGKNQGRGKEKNMMVEYIPLPLSRLSVDGKSHVNQVLIRAQHANLCACMHCGVLVLSEMDVKRHETLPSEDPCVTSGCT